MPEQSCQGPRNSSPAVTTRRSPSLVLRRRSCCQLQPLSPAEAIGRGTMSSALLKWALTITTPTRPLPQRPLLACLMLLLSVMLPCAGHLFSLHFHNISHYHMEIPCPPTATSCPSIFAGPRTAPPHPSVSPYLRPSPLPASSLPSFPPALASSCFLPAPQPPPSQLAAPLPPSPLLTLLSCMLSVPYSFLDMFEFVVAQLRFYHPINSLFSQ